MQTTIAQGPEALMSKADDGSSTREWRATAVADAEAAFAELAGQDNFANDLKAAWALADDSQRRSAIGHIVAQIALLIGIGLISGGVAAWVGGLAEGAVLARTAMTAASVARTVRIARIVGGAAQIGVDATLQASAQTVITGDSFGTAFAENLLSSAAILAALKPVHTLSQQVRQGLHAAETAAAGTATSAEKLSAARRLWKYTKSGKLALDSSVMSLELLTQAGVGAVVTRAVRGAPKNEEEATNWFVNGASLVITRVIAGRMRGLEERLHEHGKATAYLRQRVHERAQFVESHSEAVDADKAWDLVNEYRTFLQEEAILLASPDAERMFSPDRLVELQHANAQGLDVADQRAISTVALLSKQLRPISSDGVEWVGTQANVEAAISASGATVVLRDKSRVQIDVAGERRTLFVIDATEGAHAHSRLTALGVQVTPVNTDPARKQWHVRAGAHEADIQETPRRTRMEDSSPAHTDDDLKSAAQRADAERGYFKAYQAHIQEQYEARGSVRVGEAQVGLGSAGLLHGAQQPPVLGHDAESARLIVAADLDGALEHRGDQQLGQRASAVHTPEIPVAAHAPDDRRFTSQEYADASAHGRANLQANVLQGKAGHVEHYAPTATGWEHPSAALRFAVTTHSGKRVWVYADRVEMLTGPGTAKLGELAHATAPDVLATGLADGSIVAGTAPG